MSDLDVVDVADALSVDLGLPYAVVRWRCPLYTCASPSPGLWRALATLSEAPTGGLLVATVEEDLFGTPDPVASRSALIAALGDANVLDSHAISCADGLAIAVVLAPMRRPLVRGELAAVTGTSLLALHPEAVSWLEHRVRPAVLAAVDEDCLQQERVLLAAGAATLYEGTGRTTAQCRCSCAS